MPATAKPKKLTVYPFFVLLPAEEKGCRLQADAKRCPVEIVAGFSEPTFQGEEGYHTFRKGGGACRNPGAARRAGHKLDYHRSTRRVEVGWGWLLKMRAIDAVHRLGQKRVNLLGETWRELPPWGILADWFADRGDDEGQHYCQQLAKLAGWLATAERGEAARLAEEAKGVKGVQ